MPERRPRVFELRVEGGGAHAIANLAMACAATASLDAPSCFRGVSCATRETSPTPRRARRVVRRRPTASCVDCRTGNATRRSIPWLRATSARRPQFCQSRAENRIRHRHAPRAERAKGRRLLARIDAKSPSVLMRRASRVARRHLATASTTRFRLLRSFATSRKRRTDCRYRNASTHDANACEVRATEHATHQPIRLSRASSPRASITHEPRPPIERAPAPASAVRERARDAPA